MTLLFLPAWLSWTLTQSRLQWGYFALLGLFYYWVNLSRPHTMVPSLGKQKTKKHVLKLPCLFFFNGDPPSQHPLFMTDEDWTDPIVTCIHIHGRGQLFGTSSLRDGTQVFRVIFFFLNCFLRGVNFAQKGKTLMLNSASSEVESSQHTPNVPGRQPTLPTCDSSPELTVLPFQAISWCSFGLSWL